jgi:hypothetical protein
MLADQFVDAQEELHDLAEMLERHGYLDEFDRELDFAPPLCEAVRQMAEDAQESRAVSEVLAGVGFAPGERPLSDVLQEAMLLATDGEEAYALLLEAGFMTENHRVRDALREALAAAAETAEAMQELDESYQLQQQATQDVAAIARRALTNAHITAGHSGELNDCADCFTDWLGIHMFDELSI